MTPDTTQSLAIRIADGVARVALNRVALHNAFDDALIGAVILLLIIKLIRRA